MFGKDANTANQEKYRHGRFLGSGVNYTALPFTDFAADPMQVIATRTNGERAPGKPRLATPDLS